MQATTQTSVLTTKVQPAKGLQVRQENGTPIPAKGMEVVLTKYYRRRLKDGDLVLMDNVDVTAPASQTNGDK